MKTKETYLAALFKFVSQRPGLEFGKYGSAAACAVLASALWDYYRADLPPETENKGDKLRAKFRRMFGDSIASRWFN